MIPLVIPDLEQIDGYVDLSVVSIAGDLVHLTARGSRHFMSVAARLVTERPLRATVDGVRGTLNRLREGTALSDSGMLHIKVRFLKDPLPDAVEAGRGLIDRLRRQAEVGSVHVVDAVKLEVDFSSILAEACAMAESGWIDIVEISNSRVGFKRLT